MAMPHQSGAFGDLLDIRFQRIFFERFKQLADMIPTLYNMTPHNGRDVMSWSQIGALGDWSAFSGRVEYDSMTQGYDTQMTYVEFASGIQVTRQLFDDDQFNVMDRKPSGLATAAQRTRQKHAARPFNNAFSVDNYFFNATEGVATCSASHTTPAAGVSTATGFSNITTSALSATAVAAARINFVKFRDDRGNRMDVMPDEILIPPDLYETGYEIIQSSGKVDSANNNRNVHEGSYKLVEWNYLTDTNNWFLMDSSGRKENLIWSDRVPIEFAYAEDLDTIIAKWRGYMRYANAVPDWRWILGGSVS